MKTTINVNVHLLDPLLYLDYSNLSEWVCVALDNYLADNNIAMPDQLLHVDSNTVTTTRCDILAVNGPCVAVTFERSKQ